MAVQDLDRRRAQSELPPELSLDIGKEIADNFAGLGRGARKHQDQRNLKPLGLAASKDNEETGQDSEVDAGSFSAIGSDDSYRT